MPKYQGKVDLIYIDPPYNTGNDGFIYADNFNHASWLSMINNRLELSKELLNDKGSMFISIDDKEQARLKLVCDEVFGEENFVANFVWQGKYTTSNDAKYASNQNENIFCFSSNIDRFSFNLLARTESMDAAYKNPDNDSKGAWKATPLHAKSGGENNLYTITFPNGISWSAPKGRYPRYSKERLMEIYFENGLYFNKNGGIDKKTYLSEVKQGKTIGTFWSYQEAGSTHEGNEDLASILDKGVFENPKPEKLLKRICEIATKVDSKAEVFEMRNCGFQDKGEGSLVSLNDQDFGVESAIYRSKTTPIVLDFFAGSGTTLAVAQKLGRKWLGVEMGEHFYNVIIPRLKKVIAGFQSGISKECDYKGGGAFRYYELESYEEALANCEYVLECKEPQKVENKN
ncbi:site-specific DNA-methyltransferase, partial [Helicobacter ganmani]